MDSEEIVVTETESDRTRAAMDVTPTLNAEAIFSSRINENDDEHHHTIVVRSAAPILRSSEKSQTFDNIVSLNKLEDIVESNDVKVHQNQYYKQIQPTKTQQQASAHKFIVPSIVNEEESVEGSGEARGVPRGRALTPKGPRSAQTATTQTSATSLRYDTMGRQATPDIQDIITGLVKLLNGNVNVQANTQQANGRPLRPQNTRINNRGPPRISDVPPLPPDFDTPGPAGPTQLMPPLPPQPSTKIPPPYPFDRPPSHLEQTPVRPFLNGVPLPEQIVPITNQNYRPGFNNGIRPQNPPPWQRPRPRPPPTNRRPNPNLPMFKPQPPLSDSVQTHVDESFTTIPHVEEPVLQLKPGYVQEDINDQNLTESEETTTIQNVEENNNDPNETLNQNQISLPSESESFVPARDPPTVSTLTQETPKESTTENKVKLQGEPTKQEILKDMENGDKKKQTMIKNEKEKPSINNKKEEKIKDTEVGLNESTTMKNVNSNGMLLQPTPTLESSMVEITKDNTTQSSIQKSTSIILTDALPEIKVTKNATSQLSPNLVTPSSIINSQPSLPAQQSFPYHPYKPRPGIVLDDTEYRPVSGQSGGAGRRPKPPQRVPAPYGEIFDVTVSAIQGPNGGSGSATVQIENVNPISGNNGDIIVSASGDQGFVSIDGKRTYLNLFGDSAPTSVVKPTPVQKSTIGTNFSI